MGSRVDDLAPLVLRTVPRDLPGEIAIRLTISRVNDHGFTRVSRSPIGKCSGQRRPRRAEITGGHCNLRSWCRRPQASVFDPALRHQETSDDHAAGPCNPQGRGRDVPTAHGCDRRCWRFAPQHADAHQQKYQQTEKYPAIDDVVDPDREAHATQVTDHDDQISAQPVADDGDDHGHPNESGAPPIRTEVEIGVERTDGHRRH